MLLPLVARRIFINPYYLEKNIMQWQAPEYSDIRFGFEVTMYINNK